MTFTTTLQRDEPLDVEADALFERGPETGWQMAVELNSVIDDATRQPVELLPGEYDQLCAEALKRL